MQEKNQTAILEDNEVCIMRIFKAPPALVFEAWSQPDHLVQWYAPRGCSITIYDFDFRTGGVFKHAINNPAVRNCLCMGRFLAIRKPNRIVYTLSFCDETGQFKSPKDYGMENGWPDETVVTVELEEYGHNLTKLTLHQTVSESLARKTGAYPSWILMLERLEGVLKALN